MHTCDVHHRVSLLAVVAALLLSGLAQPAQAADNARPKQIYQVPRFQAPPAIDGALASDSAWEHAAVITSFVETDPGANITPPVRTLAYLGYDDEHLYFAIHSLDPHPDRIRANFNDRDKAATNDYAAIHIDPDGSGGTFFTFGANPRGVQIDFMTMRGQVPNLGFNANYQSAATITDDGWILEGKIPFQTLGLSTSSEPQMGFAFLRVYPRETRRRIVSVRRDYNDACVACQFDSMTGIQGIKARRSIELAPTVTGIIGDEDSQGGWNDGTFRPSLSAGYSVTPMTRLDVTVNPDFSQVGADNDQLDVNLRHALLFPETRPFFGGPDMFNTPGVASGLTIGIITSPVVSGAGGTHPMLFQSRAINDPRVGAKFMGKSGMHEFAIMSARDEAPAIIVPSADRSAMVGLRSPSASTVARYRTGVKQATFGALVTDFRNADGHSSVVAADFQLQPDRKFDLTGQFARSNANALGSDDIARAWGTTGTQSANAFSINARAGDQRNYNLQAGYTDIGEHFRSDLGYVPQTDLRIFDSSATYQWYGNDNPVLVRGGPSFRYVRSTNHRGELVESSFYPGIISVLKRQIWLRVHGQFTTNMVNGVRFEDQKRLLVIMDGRPARIFERIAVYYVGGDLIDFENLRPARGSDLLLLSMMQPHTRVVMEVSGMRSALDREDTGTTIFKAWTLGFKTETYFSKRMFGRVIIQDRRIDRDPLQYLAPVADRERGTNTYLLLGYTFDPRTTLFVGYDHIGFSVADAADFRRPGRSLFVKIGYTIRP